MIKGKYYQSFFVYSQKMSQQGNFFSYFDNPAYNVRLYAKLDGKYWRTKVRKNNRRSVILKKRRKKKRFS